MLQINCDGDWSCRSFRNSIICNSTDKLHRTFRNDNFVQQKYFQYEIIVSQQHHMMSRANIKNNTEEFRSPHSTDLVIDPVAARGTPLSCWPSSLLVRSPLGAQCWLTTSLSLSDSGSSVSFSAWDSGSGCATGAFVKVLAIYSSI